MEVNFYYLIPGLALILFGLSNLYRVFSRRRWPEVVGRIQRHEIVEQEASLTNTLRLDSNSGYSLKSRLGTHRETILGISYIYPVEKYKYVNSQLYSASIIRPREKIAGLQVGDKVKVFYNPANPHRSFLAHSFAWPSIFIVFIGWVFVGVGFYLQAQS